jgi:aminopeptidase N
MSTYLVAYVIGAYDHIETRDLNNVLIRVYTPVGNKEKGLFALHVSLLFFINFYSKRSL